MPAYGAGRRARLRTVLVWLALPLMVAVGGGVGYLAAEAWTGAGASATSAEGGHGAAEHGSSGRSDHDQGTAGSGAHDHGTAGDSALASPTRGGPTPRVDASTGAAPAPVGDHGAGHDSAGHDSAGHDSAGHDSAGHDSAGHDSGTHSGPANSGSGHDSAGNDGGTHSGDGHGGTAAEVPVSRPRTAVLGAFAAVNAAILLGAAVLRRRGRPRRRPGRPIPAAQTA